jgi:hypothetical protein
MNKIDRFKVPRPQTRGETQAKPRAKLIQISLQQPKPVWVENLKIPFQRPLGKMKVQGLPEIMLRFENLGGGGGDLGPVLPDGFRRLRPR